jgi:hypothetical protein
MIRRLFSWVTLAFAAVSLHAEIPSYLREAISKFQPDAPAGWAYTLTTTRDGKSSSERYDPSRPKGGEWSLLLTEGRAPTAEEIERYLRYKASNAPATNRATFERGDLDIETAHLLRESPERAEFRIRFRDGASQPLLAHVLLDLTVRKSPAAVERSVLRLYEAFSPALGVRMTELTVTATHDAPTAERPALPREIESRFRGRMFFFVSLEEDLRIVYSDYARVR